jgi:hypothetical protein
MWAAIHRSRRLRVLVLGLAMVGGLTTAFAGLVGVLWLTDFSCWRTGERAVERTIRDFERRVAESDWEGACALLTEPARRSYGSGSVSCEAAMSDAQEERPLRESVVTGALVDCNDANAHVHTGTHYYGLSKPSDAGCDAWRIDSMRAWRQ